MTKDANLSSPRIFILEPIKHLQDLLTRKIGIRNFDESLAQLTPWIHCVTVQAHTQTIQFSEEHDKYHLFHLDVFIYRTIYLLHESYT